MNAFFTNKKRICWTSPPQVLKHEWPQKWPRFIPDLVSAARSSETLCENCMVILKVSRKKKRIRLGKEAVVEVGVISVCNLEAQSAMGKASPKAVFRKQQ